MTRGGNRVVLTYGTFDLFHIGHLRLLERAKGLGEILVVGLSTDEFNWNEKRKTTAVPYADRKSILESIRFIDLVIPEECWSQKIEDVQKHDVDIFVMGDDWEGKFDFLRPHCKVVYLPRTPGVSTTDLKVKASELVRLTQIDC
jgi:glycerol-3-phosphate cytidylyltransferase